MEFETIKRKKEREVIKGKKRPIYLRVLLIWNDECPLPTYP